MLKLGNVGDEDPAVAEGLAEALRDTDPLVRRDAILAVVKLKQPGAAIKDQLETMSRSDKNARARDLAGKARCVWTRPIETTIGAAGTLPSLTESSPLQSSRDRSDRYGAEQADDLTSRSRRRGFPPHPGHRSGASA